MTLAEIREGAIARLKELQPISLADPEAAHVDADRVLCEALEKLGLADAVVEFDKIDKWYA